MKNAQREAAERELRLIHDRAEALAEALDPKRHALIGRKSRDEALDYIVRAADQVVLHEASRGLSMLEASKGRREGWPSST